MADKQRRFLDADETICYVVYDRRSGDFLMAHQITGLAGLSVPGEETIRRQVVACAAAALGRSAASLAAVAVPQPLEITDGMRVDVATAKVQEARKRAGQRGGKTTNATSLMPGAGGRLSRP
jgi:hypothetical protein